MECKCGDLKTHLQNIKPSSHVRPLPLESGLSDSPEPRERTGGDSARLLKLGHKKQGRVLLVRWDTQFWKTELFCRKSDFHEAGPPGQTVHRCPGG